MPHTECEHIPHDEMNDQTKQPSLDRDQELGPWRARCSEESRTNLRTLRAWGLTLFEIVGRELVSFHPGGDRCFLVHLLPPPRARVNAS